MYSVTSAHNVAHRVRKKSLQIIIRYYFNLLNVCRKYCSLFFRTWRTVNWFELAKYFYIYAILAHI